MATPLSKDMLLPGYKDMLTDSRSKERYQEKLKLLNGRDPYELPREAWKDDVDLWPCTTYIHVGMYLVFSPSAYTPAILCKKSICDPLWKNRPLALEYDFALEGSILDITFFFQFFFLVIL